jgi:hypothetical protein
MRLLYRTAEWHGFAKLRTHTERTLEHLQLLTKEFGRDMRKFRDQTCSQFRTFELPRETAARRRNQQRVLASVNTSRPTAGTQANASILPVVRAQSESNHETAQKVKKLNISTTKFHFIGDYVHTIQMFGCTDSYSTQLV